MSRGVEVKREYDRQRRARLAEPLRRQRAEYYAANREELLARQREYYRRNRERIIARVGARQRRLKPPRPRPTPEQRFWKFADTSGGLFACWPWTGTRQSEGYGRISVGGGRHQGAHRFALELSLGRPLAPGMHARHVVCDNPPCVNPAHLAEGTPADNVRDAVGKRRHAHGERHSVAVRQGRVRRGAAHPRGNARLDWDRARSIRARLASGERQRTVAEAFGIHPSTVSLIASGKAWAEPSA